MTNEELNNESNFDEDKFADMPSRLIVQKSLKNTLPKLNSHLDTFSNFLDEKEETFTDELKKFGTDLLQELSERINAIQRLNKVLENEKEEVFVSDIELCEEFIEDTDTFLVQIAKFKSDHK